MDFIDKVLLRANEFSPLSYENFSNKFKNEEIKMYKTIKCPLKKIIKNTGKYFKNNKLLYKYLDIDTMDNFIIFNDKELTSELLNNKINQDEQNKLLQY
jgi:hypothetical protein